MWCPALSVVYHGDEATQFNIWRQLARADPDAMPNVVVRTHTCIYVYTYVLTYINRYVYIYIILDLYIYGNEVTKSNIWRRLASDDEIPDVVVCFLLHAFLSLYLSIFLYIYAYVCVHICIYIYIPIHVDEATECGLTPIRRTLADADEIPHVVVRIYIYIYIFVYVYVYFGSTLNRTYMCVYIYSVYIYTYIYIDRETRRPKPTFGGSSQTLKRSLHVVVRV